MTQSAFQADTVTCAFSCLTTGVHATRGIFDLYRDLMVRSAHRSRVYPRSALLMRRSAIADLRARLEPWAACTALPRPILRDARPSAALLRMRQPRDEAEGVDGRFCCKQQRIYKARARASARRPGFRCAPSGLRRAGARHVALMQTPDALRRRAQFQLWIFSYTVLARPSKKWVSRIKIGSGDEACPDQAS